LSASIGNDPRTDAEKLEDLRAAYAKAVAALRDITHLLNNHIAPIPCEASLYTLSDDEFGTVMYCRDVADKALKELGE
jgi:hypothetical protein